MKHKQALCKNGETFTPEDINDIKKLVDMRYYGLTDVRQQFELVAVNAKDKKYFRFKHSPGKDLTRNESNPSHHQIKNDLLKFLKEANSLRVFTNEFIKYEEDNSLEEKTKKIETALFYLNETTISNYEWQSEVFKRISRDEYTLFDIAGYSKDVPYPTSAKPNFIFEIILSSFPKPPVFKWICDDSEINFTICILIYIPEDAIDRKSYNYLWNNINIDNDKNLAIRCTQYIDNGFFFENKNQIGHYLDEEDDDGKKKRPHFNLTNEKTEYWEKHYLYIKEKYFKKAVKKLK